MDQLALLDCEGRVCRKCATWKPIAAFRVTPSGARRWVCRACLELCVRKCGWCGAECPPGDRRSKKFCSTEHYILAKNEKAVAKYKRRRMRVRVRPFHEPIANPVWLRRADKLCAHLSSAGPQDWAGLRRWRRKMKWPPVAIPNVLAMVDGHGVEFARGKWQMVVSKTEAA